jgi:hypothetical protein
VGFRQQRDQVLALQVLLRETGGAGFGDRLGATLDGELLRRLALMQDDLRQQALNDARGSDFAWWQGEGLALAQVLGGGEAPAVLAGRMATRLDLLSQQARAMIALGTPALSSDPAVQRWLRLQAELARYQAHAADSSLLRLERYLTALGPDLRRENCAERLAAQAPVTANEDEVAQRLLQIHAALTSRCTELRVQAASVAAPAGSLPASAQ